MLTHGQKQTALDWFKAKNKGRGCPVCGASSWKVQCDATLGGVELANIHAVLFVCLNCEHLLLFNAMIAVYNPEVETEEEEP